MTFTVWLAMLLVTLPVTGAARDSRRGFINAWEGSQVVVARPLYTIVYDERGKLGHVFRGRRGGLTVVDTRGVFFRFESHGSEPDVVGRTPQEVFDRMRGAYGKGEILDILPYRRIEPTVITRYEAGIALVVRSVDIERDRVRLVLANDASEDRGERDVATTLTVQWPADLSDSLDERPEIERLIAQFLSRRSLVPPAREIRP